MNIDLLIFFMVDIDLLMLYLVVDLLVDDLLYSAWWMSMAYFMYHLMVNIDLLIR